MTETRTQHQIKMNRLASLKSKFTDRFFTVEEAAQHLRLKGNTTWDFLRKMADKGMLVKERRGSVGIYKFSPAPPTAAKLQDKHFTTEVPPTKETVVATSTGKALALPPTLIIDGVKYVRVDRLAEVLLDQL